MSEQSNNQPVVHTETESEIHLLDLLIILAREKRLVIAMPIVFGLLAMGISLMMTPIFTSTARVLPPERQSSVMSAMLGQLGGLAGAAAGNLAGIKSQGDLYVSILQSRTIADSLIAQYKLVERYDVRYVEDARKQLTRVSAIETKKKDGIITVSVTDKDPQFAATLANAYITELIKLNQKLALSEASQRRLFFEQQLVAAKEKLADAEVALRKTQERTGMLQPAAQVGMIISSLRELRAAIAAKEVQLNTMGTFATARNPEYLRAQEELRSLRAQLAKLGKDQPEGHADVMVPTGKIPEVGVEYVRAIRDVKYYETLFELLSKQFEMAKIEEAENSSVVQILDKAIPSERKSKPSRALITLGGVVAGGILGVLLALVRNAQAQARLNPAGANRMRDLIAAWKGTKASSAKSQTTA